MYACASKLVADFMRGCASKRIDHLLLATQPYHAAIHELTHAGLTIPAGHFMGW
jgi:hypothetical protein